MLLIYSECQQNSLRGKNLYAERYPHRSQPSRRTFKNVCDKLKETGSLSVRKSERRKRVTNEENEIGVLASVVKNPHIKSRRIEREFGISRWSVNVWCVITGDKIVGPHFINGNLIGNIYANFIKDTLGPLLEELPLFTRHTMWYQHDGCPTHYSLIARWELDEKFLNRRSGRGGPISWPARSPDLTPLDYFLCKIKCKQQCYNRELLQPVRQYVLTL
ncbi:hypothetical protein WN55_01768 [Dufourea novaeangliae]|uniref:DUF4817 domain-containing protein n=1 Tax=Dufourea novaeangliae TaxID=178035 RepID=A0A154NW14_DUFNO|nr:hypothetical protein WN55_01768 [Dufourea novaeangliae]